MNNIPFEVNQEKIKFEANREKIKETILYIASKVNNPSLHTIFKLMYFSDKMHLEKYARFITGDSYIAMEYGPVPSVAFDITKDAAYIPEALGIKVEGYHITCLREPNIDVFSYSDTECLDAALEMYGHKTFGELTDASHDAAWHSAPENGEISVESIIAMFDESEDLLAHLQNEHP